MQTEIDGPLPGGSLLRPPTPPDEPAITQNPTTAGEPTIPDEPSGAEGTATTGEPAIPGGPTDDPTTAGEPTLPDEPTGAAGLTGPDGLDSGSPPVRRRRAVSAQSRRPASHRPPPPSTRILGVCAWATGIGIVGLAVALYGLDAVLGHTDPAWYEPTLSGVGLAGVVLTLAALASAERVRLPWVMLGLATVPVAVNLGLTVGAL